MKPYQESQELKAGITEDQGRPEDLQEFEAGVEDAEERLDKYLARIYENQSRSFFQKLIREHQVLVNGVPQKAGYRLSPEDMISVNIPKAQEVEILPEDIPLDILYEDADVLIVNKPKGMVVHPSAGHWSRRNLRTI